MKLLVTSIAIGASLATGWWISKRSQPTVIALPAPTIASTTPAIHVAIQPIVAEPTAASYRPRKPMLRPDCVTDRELLSECDGDHGFPAISPDGKTIVDAVHPDTGLSGYPALLVVYMDARDARSKRTVTILAISEWNPTNGADDATTAMVRRRVAAVQRELDAAGYRSMHAISDQPADGAQLRGEWEDFTLHVRHIATGRRVGQYAFEVETPASTEHCSYILNRIDAWWDPVTRLGFGRQGYSSGDFCDSPTVAQTFQL